MKDHVVSLDLVYHITQMKSLDYQYLTTFTWANMHLAKRCCVIHDTSGYWNMPTNRSIQPNTIHGLNPTDQPIITGRNCLPIDPKSSSFARTRTRISVCSLAGLLMCNRSPYTCIWIHVVFTISHNSFQVLSSSHTNRNLKSFSFWTPACTFSFQRTEVA